MKSLNKILFIIVSFFLFHTNVAAVAVCESSDILKAVRILAYVIWILKIVLPLAIIITSIIGLTKTILEDGNQKEYVGIIVKKFIIAALVFFIPTIVSVTMSLVSTYDKSRLRFSKCLECLTSVSKCNEYIK